MKILSAVTTAWIGFILFIAPLKFGNSASQTHTSFFPLGLADAIVGPWPLGWVAAFCGIALILALIAHRKIDKARLTRSRYIWAPPLLLFGVCWIGWINATTYAEAISFTHHMAGVTCFAFASVIHLHATPRHRNILLGCFVAGVTLLCIHAMAQYFYLYDMDLKMLEEQRKAMPGFEMQDQIISRLKQKRPTAFFAIPNSLAGHLVLVMPVIVMFMWKWGKNVDPPRISQFVLAGLFTVVVGFTLFTTKSRAAMGGFILALLLLVAMLAAGEKEVRRKYWWALATVAIVILTLGVIGYILIRDGRSLSSLDARLTYWHGAWMEFLQHPLAGVGFGGFFRHFLYLKPPGAETARLAHSMFYHMLAQCGILGGIATIFFLASPLLIWRQFIHKPGVDKPVLYATCIGMFAWLVHACTDFNIHIPATLITLPFLATVAILPTKQKEEEKAPQALLLVSIPLGLLALASTIAIGRTGAELRLAQQQYLLSMMRPVVDGFAPRYSLDYLRPITRKTAAKMPYSPHPWIKLGVRALREERWDIAAEAYGHVVEIDPDYAAGHYKYAKALANLGDLKKAEEHLRIALTWNPHQQDYTELWKDIQHKKAAQRE